jgi:hypothetical protein
MPSEKEAGRYLGLGWGRLVDLSAFGHRGEQKLQGGLQKVFFASAKC